MLYETLQIASPTHMSLTLFDLIYITTHLDNRVPLVVLQDDSTRTVGKAI
eukprot:m.114492 g.114492  ORF g.114492 m.114492 type:complete len:50 (-) comp13540_c0_seq2:1025-1174(-)